MYLWWAQYDNEEWGCFVIAESRGQAKSMFHGWNPISGYGNENEYTDVRVYKRKEVDGYEPTVFDENCPKLEVLGERFCTQEEMEALGY